MVLDRGKYVVVWRSESLQSDCSRGPVRLTWACLTFQTGAGADFGSQFELPMRRQLPALPDAAGRMIVLLSGVIIAVRSFTRALTATINSDELLSSRVGDSTMSGPSRASPTQVGKGAELFSGESAKLTPIEETKHGFFAT